MDNPTGNVTFLFTDIEGSTRLAQESAGSLQSSLQKHNSILHEVIEMNNGFVFKTVGDAFCCAFGNADDALKAAVSTQLKLNSEIWNEAEIKVRMGLHTGNAEWNGSDYMGYITLARTQRIMSAASGGQVVISNDSYENLYKSGDSDISFRDLGERRLKDLIHPMKLYQVISNGIQSDFPPLKTLDARPNNLPVQLTNFIGREKEISYLKNLLQDKKIITLLGPGGTGKTRLSLQVAADTIDDFENGVWFVELASLSDPFLLSQAIVTALGLTEQPGETLEKILENYLCDKELLLILDNCEHLIYAVAEIAEKLLHRSPKLKLITTSRTALRCSGEIIHKVLPLEHPNPGINLTLQKLTQYEAVKLFIERALAVNPSFRVKDENAQALAQICFQLDGIPLAIELAAVRTKVLTLENISRKLEDRFRLLTGGKRTALPRQQTLKALIDWSYDLLTEKEKIFWRRLSVFSDGWTIEDAEAVCTDLLLDDDDIIDLTSCLIEKSIVLFIENTGGYKMLQTIKQYGAERLMESGEEDIFNRRHLMHFLNLYEPAIPEFNGPKTKFWLDMIENHYSNIQKAISWSIENNFPEDGGRLTVALGMYWDVRGNFSEGRSRLDTLLSGKHKLSQLLTANLKRIAGVLASQQGQPGTATKYIEECLEIYRSLSDKKGISNSLNVLGLLKYDVGEYEKAKVYLNESLVLKKEIADEIGTCSALNSLGLVSLISGEINEAKKYFEESLDIAGRLNDDTYKSISYNNLAEVYANLENFEKSDEYFNLALKIDRRLGNNRGVCVCLYNLGTISYTKKDFTAAKKTYTECLELCKELDHKQLYIFALSGIGQVTLATGDKLNAEKYFKECLTLQKEYMDIKCTGLSMSGLAEIYFLNDDYELAIRLITAIKSKTESIGVFIDKDFDDNLNSLLGRIKEKIGDEKTLLILEKSKGTSIEEAIQLIANSE